MHTSVCICVAEGCCIHYRVCVKRAGRRGGGRGMGAGEGGMGRRALAY